MLDLGTKIEYILSELISVLFWSSVLDILLFSIAFILFCVDSTETASLWWHSPHMVRGVIGIYLIKNLPTTQDIIKQANIPPEQRFTFN